MSDFIQNLGLNYHNFQNHQNNQENQCPPLSQDNENDLPTEELIYSQNQSENNNQNYTPQKPEEYGRVSDANAPPVLNPDMATDQQIT